MIIVNYCLRSLHDSRPPRPDKLLELFIKDRQEDIEQLIQPALDGTVTGKRGITYQHRTGLCLETENFPDAPNHDDFPSAVLRPGDTYHHTMIHRFSVD